MHGGYGWRFDAVGWVHAAETHREVSDSRPYEGFAAALVAILSRTASQIHVSTTPLLLFF